MAKLKSVAATAALLSAITVSDSASAALITKDIAYDSSQISGDLTFDFTGFDYNIVSDAQLTFWTVGDLGDGRYTSYCGRNCGSRSYTSDNGYYSHRDNQGEYIDVSADGYSFGRWLDSNDLNDSIDGSDIGRGTYWTGMHSGTALISQTTFEQMVEDDMFSVSFNYSNSVNLNDTKTFARVQLSFESGLAQINNDPNRVPAPGSLLLLLTGAAVVGSRRIIKKS